jgi:rhodanese-related sulfurtransferase
MPGSEPLEIDVLALSRRLASDNPPVILDVREPWELEIAAIGGVLAIPLGELPRQVSKVPRDRPVAAMCHHGGRSASATAWLRAQGFDNVMNVAGGIDAWARLVDPELKRY